MPLFYYKAADEAGKILKNTIDKDNQAEVTEYLSSKGLYPLKVRKLSLLNMEISDLIKKPVSLKTLALFCRHLSFFMESGVLLPRAFKIMSAQAKDKRLKRMLMDIHEHSLGGKSLSECLKLAPVPLLMPALCRIGEESGRLNESIRQMADYYETEFKNKQSVTGALIYPAAMAVMMFAVMILAVVHVLPNYAAMFEAEDIPLPLPTRILMDGSYFILDNSVFILLSAILFALLVFLFLRSPRGKIVTGFIKLRIPFWRLGMNLRFCKCMAMLLSAGKPASEAIYIIRDAIGNAYLDNTFSYMTLCLKQGRQLSNLLTEVKHFDFMLINMVEIGEETGSLCQPLSQCAQYYQIEQDRAYALLAKLAEPVIMIFLGAVLALIMLSIILPTYAMINNF